MEPNVEDQAHRRVEDHEKRYSIDLNRLSKDFVYHPPTGDQTHRYTMIRDEAKELAALIMNLTPPSREQSLALTSLEEAVMWANASIARNEG